MNATRYHCSTETPSQFHDAGAGKPRSKVCKYCRKPLVIELGTWGAYEWCEVPPSFSALVKTFASKPKADEWAEQNGHVYIRWIEASP
jgi:hypothetical protein